MRIRASAITFRIVVVAIYAFMLAPILIVVALSFDPSPSFQFPPRGLSLRWFEAFLANESSRRTFFGTSLPVALVTSLIATTIGVLAAMGLRGITVGRRVIETYLVLPMLVPEVILAVALSLFFIETGFRKSYFTLVVGHVLLTLPFVIRTVSSSLSGVSRQVEEAAVMLGATLLQKFFLVVLPLIRSGVISGALFAFIISFGDINLSLFLAGPNTMTVPVYIFSELQWGADPKIAAISTLQILIVATFIFVIGRFAKLRFGL